MGSLSIQPSYVVPPVFLIMEFLGIFPISTLFDGRCPQAYLEELGGSSVRERGDTYWGNCRVSQGKRSAAAKYRENLPKKLHTYCHVHMHMLLFWMLALKGIVSSVFFSSSAKTILGYFPENTQALVYCHNYEIVSCCC